MAKEIIIDENRGFQGVWIPKNLYMTNKFNARTKFFLVEVKSLSKNGYCYATDKHFADFLGISERMVQNIINDLKKRNYIRTEYEYDGDTKAIKRRFLILTQVFYNEFYNEKEENNGTEKNFSRGTEKNCGYKYNNNKESYFINRSKTVATDFDDEILEKAKEYTDNETILDGINYFLKNFKQRMNKPHPNIAYRSLDNVIENIEELLVNVDDIEDFENSNGFRLMIDNYFDTEYTEDVDYKIQHFASGKVLEYQARTCGYITGWRD